MITKTIIKLRERITKVAKSTPVLTILAIISLTTLVILPSNPAKAAAWNWGYDNCGGYGGLECIKGQDSPVGGSQTHVAINYTATSEKNINTSVAYYNSGSPAIDRNISSATNYIYPYVDLWVYKGPWNNGPGCYIDENGDGYLITSLSGVLENKNNRNEKITLNLNSSIYNAIYNTHNLFMTTTLSSIAGTKNPYVDIPNAEKTPYTDITGVTRIFFEPIDVNSLKPGVEYELKVNYTRRNICSYSADQPPTTSGLTVVRNPHWTINGQSYISKTGNRAGDRAQGTSALQHIRPGQYLYWDHDLRNGPSNTGYEDMGNETVTINIDNLKCPLDSPVSNCTSYVNPGGFKDGGEDNELFFEKYLGPIQVQQSDVGYRLCQRVAWKNKAWNDSSWGTSNWACAEIEYHYPDPNGINMTVTSNKTTIQPGDNVTFNYTITAKSGPTKTRDIQYRTYTFIIPGSNSLPSNKDQTAYYNPAWSYVECGGRSVPSSSQSYCAQGHSGSTGELAPITGIKTDSNTYTIDGNWAGQPGDQICSYIAADNNWSVNNGQSASTYIASKIYCVRIGKKPQIQINGADSYAKSGFTGSSYYASSLSANRGSYSQYGLLTGSSAAITNFGSAGYTTVNSTNATKAKTLAFANVGSSLGNAGINNSLSLPVSPSSTQNLSGTSLSINSLNGSSDVKYYHSSASNLTITGGNLNAGTYAVLFVDGDVTITGNITYGGGENASYSSLANIPNLTIIANNIYVNGNVTYLFGNYVARNGAFNTCSNMNNLGTAGNCANKLKINGAVISKGSPVLRRVFGSGNSTTVNQWTNNTVTASSEWFNYTPNTWLTPYLKNNDNSVTGFTTMNITSLPARY